MVPSPDIQAPASPARTRWGSWAALILGVGIILGALPATWFFRDSPVRDEVGHIPLVRRWAAHPESVSIARFPEPKGVALFAASAAWGRAFGTDCATLRSMIVLLAVACLAAWMELVALWGLSRRFAVGVAILAVPYFFIYTQMLYTEIPALLLTFLGLICAERLRRGGKLLWGLGLAASLGLLLWVRQTFIIVPVGLLLCSPWMGPRRRAVAASAVAACLALVPMLAMWNGLVPPGEAKRFGAEGGLYVDAFAFGLGALGTMGWPLLLVPLAARARVKDALLLAGAALAFGLLLAMPVDYTSPERMGLLQKGLISLPLSPWLPRAVLLLAMCAGGVILARLAYLAVRPPQPWMRLPAVLAVLTALAPLGATPIFYDRYLILACVIIFALAADRAAKPAVWFFLTVFGIVTIAHAAYVCRHPTPSHLPVPLAMANRADLRGPNALVPRRDAGAEGISTTGGDRWRRLNPQTSTRRTGHGPA